MPVYEYRCTQCRHTFEEYRSVGESAPACPACGGPTRKVYASVGLIFKGSGFHTTDYRKTPAGNGDRPPATSETSASDSTSPTSPSGASTKS
jgi:putative FmdB family regulatory protein